MMEMSAVPAPGIHIYYLHNWGICIPGLARELDSALFSLFNFQSLECAHPISI